MSARTPQEQISRKRVVYRTSGVDAAVVRRDVEYRIAGNKRLGIDFYYPPGMTSGVAAPAVIFVTGFSDAGAQKALGCRFKRWERTSRGHSWLPPRGSSASLMRIKSRQEM